MTKHDAALPLYQREGASLPVVPAKIVEDDDFGTTATGKDLDVVDAEIVLRHDGGHGHHFDIPDHMIYGVVGHSAAKLVDSGVAPLVAAARPYTSLSTPQHLADARDTYGLPKNNSRQSKALVANTTGGRDTMTMPIYTPLDLAIAKKTKSDPAFSGIQWRPSHPEKDPKSGKALKYEFPAGATLPMGVHPATPADWIDSAAGFVVGEGTLKSDALLTAWLLANGVKPQALKVTKAEADKPASHFRARLARIMNKIPGADRVVFATVLSVTAWRKNPEWRSLNLKGKQVWIALDGDIMSNNNVHKQLVDLWEFLRVSHKARLVQAIVPVDPTGEDEKIGGDDYVAQHGTWSNLVEQAMVDLPAAPERPAAGGHPVGSQWIEPAKGVMILRSYEVTQRDANGMPLNTAIIETPVVNASVEIIATEETVGGYPDDLGHDRVTTRHDLRVVAGGVEKIVRGWKDEDLRDIEGILRQAGAAARTAAWHESLTPKMHGDIATGIRTHPAEDCEQRLAIERNGLVDLGPEYIPAKTYEDAPDLDKIWAWTTGQGTVPPRGYAVPKVRAAVAKTPEPHRVPDESSIEQTRRDVKAMLVTAPAVMKDTAIYHATLGKTIQAIMGGHPTGSVYGWAPHGSGKSVILRLCYAINFGGLPTSLVNATKTWMTASTAGRTDILTTADDLRREPNDEKTWPATHSAADTLLRLGYDGPQAARGRMEMDMSTGKYKAADKDEAWPAVVVFGELDADFADSTMERTLVVGADRDMIHEGKAKSVLMETLIGKGVPQRLGREFLADYLLDLSVKATQGVDWAQDHRSLTERRNAILAAQVDTDDDGNSKVSALWPQAKEWTTRQMEVAVGPILGIAALAKWARSVVEGDTDPNGMTVEQVDEWEKRAKHDILNAMQKHHDNTSGEGGRDRTATLIDTIRRAIVTGNLTLAPGSSSGNGPTEVKPGAVVYGIGANEDGEDWIYVMPEEIAGAPGFTGVSVRDVEAAIKNAGACKTADGTKWKHRKTHRGAQVRVMKIREQHLLGTREEDSKGHLKVIPA